MDRKLRVEANARRTYAPPAAADFQKSTSFSSLMIWDNVFMIAFSFCSSSSDGPCCNVKACWGPTIAQVTVRPALIKPPQLDVVIFLVTETMNENSTAAAVTDPLAQGPWMVRMTA